MPTKTIAYLRVSTDKQADRGVSLDARAVRLHRGVLQPGAQALDAGVLEPSSVREGSTDGAGSSVINLSTESGQAHRGRRPVSAPTSSSRPSLVSAVQRRRRRARVPPP